MLPAADRGHHHILRVVAATATRKPKKTKRNLHNRTARPPMPLHTTGPLDHHEEHQKKNKNKKASTNEHEEQTLHFAFFSCVRICRRTNKEPTKSNTCEQNKSSYQRKPAGLRTSTTAHRIENTTQKKRTPGTLLCSIKVSLHCSKLPTNKAVSALPVNQASQHLESTHQIHEPRQY